jgi:hypothetical protein
MSKPNADHERGCPLAVVDRRLRDVHQLWHEAERGYFRPEKFRLAAQNAIQTLRTVTFILQKHKHPIPDFELWYGSPSKAGRWQERLHADALMRWMVEARNNIEKQGDLETNSFVRAEIIASYLDEGPGMEVPARLFDSYFKLLRSVPRGALGRHVMENGTLRIQRRWLENSLPDYELLDALAIAYGRITELVHDAHRQMAIAPPKITDHETGELLDIDVLGWRMPCMIAHDEPRSLLLSLADGSVLQFARELVTVTAEDGARAIEKYGPNTHDPMRRDYDNEEAMAAGYFEIARSVFLRDAYHQPIVFLVRERKLVKICPAPAENQQQKYLVMRRLANEAIRHGADGAMMVGEFWTAPQSDLAPYQRPAEVKTREEGLHLTMVTKGGEPIEFVAMIQRDGNSVSLGETSIRRGGAAFSFGPFYKAWGRPIPEAWIRMAQSGD